MKVSASIAASCAATLALAMTLAAAKDSAPAQKPAPGQPNPMPHSADPLETIQKRLQTNKAVLYDVREKWEWKEGHLAQANLLPLSVIGKKLREEAFVAKLKKRFPEDKPIYLHCKSGGRCVLAAKALRKKLGRDYDFRPLKEGYVNLLEAGFEKAKPKVTPPKVMPKEAPKPTAGNENE